MGCGLISQRGPAVEVHHPLTPDPAVRAAGARVVGVPAAARAPAATSVASRPGLGEARGSHEHRRSAPGPVPVPVPEPTARPSNRLNNRRFLMGERVLMTSRLPSNLQDHAFCFECGAFFHLESARAAECTRCSSSFVQYLRSVGGENWVSASSSAGMNFSFDDQLDNSVTASLHETPAPKRPTQASFIRGLPMSRLEQPDLDERSALDASDPRQQCSICREAFKSGEMLKQLPCSHEFHESCICPWLQSNNTCPICRWKMPEGLDGEDDEDDVVSGRPSGDREHSAGYPGGLSCRQTPRGQEAGTV